jgi:hypothetical protein
MKLILRHRKNPDIVGGYWQKPVHSGRETRLDVRTYADASRIVRQYIATNHLGMGNWTGDAGVLLDDAGKRIAYVSYNGRVWEGDPRRGDWASRKEIEVDRG